jgi:hypothetical protein
MHKHNINPFLKQIKPFGSMCCHVLRMLVEGVEVGSEQLIIQNKKL